jgi:hypothetical protein
VAEGQRLRWWQEQEEQSGESQRASERVSVAAGSLLPEPGTTPAAETVSLAEEYSDTWEDLEAEALRRAEQAKLEEAESISFVLDKSTALAHHRRSGKYLAGGFGSLILLVVALYLTLYITHPHGHHSPPPFGMIGCFATFFSIYYRRLKWLESTDKPTVRLAPQGIFIDSSTHPDTALPWNEVVEVKAKGPRNRRYLEIRASKRRRFVIAEQDLPVSAEALATRIAIYETGRGIA